MKQKIDQELETYLATETESILNETDSYRASMKPKYDQEYQERVSNLVDRFNGAKSEWYSKPYERITLPRWQVIMQWSRRHVLCFLNI
ncbi:hypothetical protein MGH68_13460 [Erysipelothrix sp. D19-032]